MKLVGYVICDGDKFVGRKAITAHINAGNPTISGEYVISYNYPRCNKLSEAFILDTIEKAEDMLVKMSHYHYDRVLTIKELYI